ncbi:unnamed protein product, partial [marine sediment metagenome]
VLNSVKAALEDVAKVERDFRMEGRRLTIVLVSKVKSRQSPRQAPEKVSSDPAES